MKRKLRLVKDEVKRNEQVKRREVHLENICRSNVMNTVNEHWCIGEVKHRGGINLVLCLRLLQDLN